MIDSALLELLPHRPPMLLIQRLVHVADNEACAELTIGEDSTFYQAGCGVPSWIGLEYMGQTCALIGGHQQRQSQAPASLGFLMGSRRFQASIPYFSLGTQLRIQCKQIATVGESLANFDCVITDVSAKQYSKQDNQHQQLAHATLSVFRKAIEPVDTD